MNRIEIEAQNPLDLREEELEGLVAEMRQSLPEYEIALKPKEPMPAGARGVTWWQVVHIYLPELGKGIHAYVLGKILEIAYKWARHRFRRKKNIRPTCAIVHGDEGKEVGSMVLQSDWDKALTSQEATARSNTEAYDEARRRLDAAKKRRSGKKKGATRKQSRTPLKSQKGPRKHPARKKDKKTK